MALSKQDISALQRAVRQAVDADGSAERAHMTVFNEVLGSIDDPKDEKQVRAALHALDATREAAANAVGNLENVLLRAGVLRRGQGHTV